MPAARLFLLLGLLSLAGVCAVVAPSLGPVVVAGDALLMVAFLVDVRRAARAPLRATRTLPPTLSQGTSASVSVQVVNERKRPVVLIAREALHPGLADGPRRQALVVPPRAAATWTYTLVPRRRGEIAYGPLHVRVRGPWGLAWSQRELIPARARRVYPQIRWEGRVGQLLALAHRRELGQAPVRARGVGVEPYALREYRQGDPLSRVHWRASARHGRLVAREDAWERGRPLVILLDCARAMVSLEAERSKLDHALAAALALTRVALGRGDRVTILAFSNRVERLVRLHAGARGAARAYESLFDLAPRLTEPAYDTAVETLERAESRRATVVLLTSVVDLAAAELLHESLLRLRRRHRVVLVNLEDPALAGLALGAPETVEQAFAKTSALEVLLDNRRLARRLRRSGIHSVAGAADRLAWQTLAAYLSLSQRGARGSGRTAGRV